MRRECERRTGLKWIQVYKWIFDRRNKGKPRKRPVKKSVISKLIV